MKYLYLILISIGSTSLCAQDYFSRILPTLDRPLVKVLKKVDNKYLIPTDFFSTTEVKGGFLIVDEDGEVETSKYENMDLCSFPIEIVNNEYYLLGENPNREGDSTFFISKLASPMGTQIWYNEFHVESPKHNPRTILEVNNYLYAIVVELESANNYPQEISLFKFNMNGDFLDVNKFNINKWSSFAWQSFVTSDKSIIMSSLISEFQSGGYGQLIKINTAGEILWNYEGEEELDNGAVPTWATELSDSTILQTYYVNRTQDVDFIVNNWFRIPNRFIWLSKDGELIREKLIITEFEDRIVYSGVESGQGDYFYAYGYLESLDPAPGLKYSCHLTKFSNSGDTLWTHNYRHPLHLDNNVIHTIKDVLEEDNGDITVLADIRAPGAKVEVWLFKINSEGCYVNEECEDMSDITSTTSVENHKTVLYPNPASGMVHVECAAKIRHISVMDIAGKLISRYFIDGSNTNIDLGAFEDGVYIFQIVDEGGKVETRKVIKL